MPEARERRDRGAILILSVAGLIALMVVVFLIRGLASQGEYESERAEGCESDYGYFLQNESYDHSAQNSHLWSDFNTDCAEQVAALATYIDARTTVRASGNDCIGLGKYIDAELMNMLESYGECDGAPLADRYEASIPPIAEVTSAAPETADDRQSVWPGGDAVGWNEAAAHVGTTQRVCGPLTSIRATGDGTFVNIGKDYPSADRFTFIFWNIVLDPIDSDSVVCGLGEIYLYDGALAQMEMWDPAALEIWR